MLPRTLLAKHDLNVYALFVEVRLQRGGTVATGNMPLGPACARGHPKFRYPDLAHPHIDITDSVLSLLTRSLSRSRVLFEHIQHDTAAATRPILRPRIAPASPSSRPRRFSTHLKSIRSACQSSALAVTRRIRTPVRSYSLPPWT